MGHFNNSKDENKNTVQLSIHCRYRGEFYDFLDVRLWGDDQGRQDYTDELCQQLVHARST